MRQASARRHRWFRLGAGLLALAATSGARAATYCQPPLTPGCVGRLIKSSVADEFNACRVTVVAFQNDAQRYLDCLRQAELDVAYDVEQAILRFNRCANEGLCAGQPR